MEQPSPNVIRNWSQMAVNRRPRKKVDPSIPHVGTVLRDGEWSGSSCVLLGGGPSLTRVMHRLREFPPGTRFAAANQSWKIDPAPSVVYVIDKQLLFMAQEKFAARWTELSGRQIRITNRASACAGPWAGTYWVEQISADDWGDSFKTGIIAANNTGLGLLNVVDILGANPIILLGYDVASEGPKLNWHDDYPNAPGWKPRRPEKSFARWKVSMQSAAGKVRSKVFNANPKSGYENFEKITFDEAIVKAEEAIHRQAKEEHSVAG